MAGRSSSREKVAADPRAADVTVVVGGIEGLEQRPRVAAAGGHVQRGDRIPEVVLGRNVRGVRQGVPGQERFDVVSHGFLRAAE